MKKVVFLVTVKGGFSARTEWVKVADLDRFIATHDVVGVA